jgi:hypothetical protein
MRHKAQGKRHEAKGTRLAFHQAFNLIGLDWYVFKQVFVAGFGYPDIVFYSSI